MIGSGPVTGTRHALFLDRDGVVNEVVVRDGIPHPPNGTEDRSVCVEDRWRDVEGGKRAGVPAIFIGRDYGERGPTEPGAAVFSLRDRHGSCSRIF